MKGEVLVTLTAAVLGYLCLANQRDFDKTEASAGEEIFTSKKNSARENDAITEYQDMMLDDEEKFQLALEQANRLVDLVGLAEKKYRVQAGDDASLRLLIEKMARLFPAQSLDYYEVCPTDGLQNREMHDAILWKWADLDFKACMAYLRSKPALFNRNFCEQWDRLADKCFKSHPQVCVDVFAGFSAELQRELIEKTYMDEKFQEAVLNVIKDPALVGIVKESLTDWKRKDVEARKKMLEEVDAAWQKETLPRVLSQTDEWKEAWKKEWPDPAVIVNAIRSLPSQKERREMLDWVAKPRKNLDGNIAEKPQAWLARISEVLRNAEDVPLSALEFHWNELQPYREVLADWLPQQSPALQRVWAESVVRFQPPEESFAWAEKLATESLRHDMRDVAWERWVANGAKEAAAALMTQATPEEREMHLPAAVYGWAMRDYAAAKQWLDAQPESEAKRQALQRIEDP
jgi:hypothetical protein